METGPCQHEELPGGVAAFPFQKFTSEPVATERATTAMRGDGEVNLKIVLGRARMPRNDALQLRRGEVVPLGKSAGDPVDVYAAGRLVARGEVVVLEGNFCVRVTQLVNRMKASA